MPRQATADRFQFRLTGASRLENRRGFTLAELLVVIGIIVLLISILIPVVGRVRIAGQSADTASLIRAIDAACQTYYQDHQAWPGPLGESQLGIDGTQPEWRDDPPNPQYLDSMVAVGGTPGDGFFRPSGDLEGVTSSENLVLGLLGGLVHLDTDSPPDGVPDAILYDPSAVGRGAAKLGGRSPGAYSAYFDAREQNLSMHVIGDNDASFGGNTGEKWGRFVLDASAARDTIIPEFIDRFSDPLPILYMRAQSTGRSPPVAGYGPEPVFNLNTVFGYLGYYVLSNPEPWQPPEMPYIRAGGKPLSSAHEAKGSYHGLLLDADLPVPGATLDQKDLPFAGEYYFASPDAGTPTAPVARQRDRYVLISAGADRIYGTEDDITSFGSVK